MRDRPAGDRRRAVAGTGAVGSSLLPPGHWARAEDAQLAQYPHDVARAEALLDEAGLRPGTDGVRLRLTLKTSTDETTRLLAAILQQQLRAAGIELQTRSSEFGTFYSDITKGAFQIYVLRWIGSNEDPDIFRYAYGSAAFRRRAGIGDGTPIRRWTRCWPRLRGRPTRHGGGRTMWPCRRFSRRICRGFRCGIRTTRWCTTAGCAGSCRRLGQL